MLQVIVHKSLLISPASLLSHFHTNKLEAKAIAIQNKNIKIDTIIFLVFFIKLLVD